MKAHTFLSANFVRASLLLPLFLITPAFAANYIGPASGDWETGANWDTGLMPATVESVTINGASVVKYNGGGVTPLVDLNVNGGGSLTLSGGATLTQDLANWTQINNGTLNVNGSTLQRTAGGNFVGSQIAGTAGAPTTSVINFTNNAKLVIGGNFSIAYANYTHSTVSFTNSTAVVAELWLGSNTASTHHQTGILNINNSSITTTGAVGMWLWDYNNDSNSFSINFSGPAGSYIHAINSIGIRNVSPSGTANNAATWETLWDLGFLTAEGKSGLTGDLFSNYFQTTGTPGRETTVDEAAHYRLTYAPVPEPSAVLLGALGGLALVRRRRA